MAAYLMQMLILPSTWQHSFPGSEYVTAATNDGVTLPAHVPQRLPSLAHGSGCGGGLGGNGALGGWGGRGGGDGSMRRGPQSLQSVQAVHDEYSLPRPPSSQSPSDEKRHVLTQVPLLGGPGEGGGGVTYGG